jgi:DNA repair protein RadA/Sms
VFGEVSLSGDVRQVGRMDSRLKESAKLGFKQALAPAGIEGAPLRITGVSRLADAIRRIGDADWT